MDKSASLTLSIAVAAMTGAAYAVLTIALAPISYAAVQLRVSEALCILPYFFPSTAWGLFVGCFLANLITGNIFDILFGSLATLGAGLLTAYLGRRARRALADPAVPSLDVRSYAPSQLLACFMPVIFNAVIVGAVITGAYEGMNIFRHFGLFLINGAWVGLGELVALFVIGFPLMRYLPTLKSFRAFVNKVNSL